MSPEGPYLSSKWHGVGGQIWGPGPPKWKFMIFIVTQFPNVKSENGSGCWQRLGSPFIPEILDIYCGTIFRENGVRKFWGWGTFSISPPWGAHFPHLTLADFGPGGPDKNIFCSGGSPTIWGSYGVWPVCTLAHFFSNSDKQILEILNWSIVPTACYRFWDFKENLTRVTQINFAQTSEKMRYLTFSGVKGENIQSRGRYNGLMLKFSPGEAVTVRDRPMK